MRTFCIVNYHRKWLKNVLLQRLYCTKQEGNKIENIRNIGILAHIDAGKTTTTERMLFYSGTIRSMGEVHHGTTVTDYMEQERQRGITITSAAVTFPWMGHQINLIDTPGHIDFTMEVEQSMTVLDGAIVVMDGSAGVEAQTLTVWRQAAGYHVPRLIYLNKMDRNDANEKLCINSIKEKLDVVPLLLHTPVKHEDKLIGLIDIVRQEEIVWTQGRGWNFTRRKLSEQSDGHIWETTAKLHAELIDLLTSLDDALAEIVIQQESLTNIHCNIIDEAICRCTKSMTAYPVLCGSSYKNIGVQTLIDAVISYLPSPLECNPLYKSFETELAARAFKVQHDDQKGVLTFLRLYSGDICKGQKIYSLRQGISEQAGNLYVALADDYKPVDKVTAGNIAVIAALKTIRTGDLITSTQTVAKRAASRLSTLVRNPEQLEKMMLPSARMRLQALDTEPSPDEVANVLLGIGTTIPDPVFLCSIEPPSIRYQTALETALEELQREDPSLRVTTNEETGQTVLSGMGELHIEIIKERIIREYGIEVDLGPLQIAYKESLVGTSKETYTTSRKIGNSKQEVKVTMSAKTVKGVPQDKVLKLDSHSPDSASNLSHVQLRTINVIRQAVSNALLQGPKLGCPLVDVQVTLHWLEVAHGTSDTTIASTVVQCLRKVFAGADSVLLEPVMFVQVVTPDSHSSRVLADLVHRRSEIQQVNVRHGSKVIECLTPLSELLGYSSTLRSISSGLASFTMEFHSNQPMAPQDEEKAVKNVTGF